MFSREMMGAWQPLGNPFAGGSELERAYTFYSQPTAVIKVQHLAGRYVVMTDNWDTDELGASRYTVLLVGTSAVSSAGSDCKSVDPNERF